MTERKTTYCYKHKTPILSREETHKHFGGKIYSFDFETEYSGRTCNKSQIASRIATDLNFDRQCKLNSKNERKETNMLKQKKLIYEILGETVLGFDLHNGYTVIAISNWIFEKEKYEVTLYLKENTIDMLDLIQEAEKIEFNSDKNSIKLDITKHVSNLLSEGFFDKYIERYEYTTKCFDKGNEFFCNEVEN